MTRSFTPLLQSFVFATILFLSPLFLNAQSGIYESYAVLNLNGAGNTYYDMQAVTGNPDLNGANLGSFVIGQTLVVAGGENKTFKCSPCNITNGTLNYRVWTGTPSGSFTGVNLPFNANLGTGCGGNDQRWSTTGNTTNILSGLPAGNYTLEIYSTADYDGCGSGTHYSSNGGANYAATFTVTCPTITVTPIVTDATCAGGGANGAIDISVSGGTPLTSPVTQNYTQNFNTLASTGTANVWTDNSTLANWYSNKIVYIANSGTGTTGGLHSFGTIAADRAIGSLGSSTAGTIYYAIKITNNMAETATSVSVNYTGEQWRNGGNATAHKLDFTYQRNAANITAGTWVDVNTLDFTGPIATASAAALDGNAIANRTALSNTITVSILPGETIWLRWMDVDDSGNDHGLGVDDLSVTLNGTTSYYLYSWTNGASTQDISGLIADAYNVVVTDANGCTGTSNNFVSITGQSTFYADTDGDLYGDAMTTESACSASAGFVADNTDCDDSNGAINPGATEICNGIDDDCDGLGDYDDGIIFLDYYADLDGDGYGSGAAFGFCSDPGGTYVLLNGDCDDDNIAVNPAATEICNGIDDDCDGLGDYDDGIIFLDYYADLDGDGYGSGAAFGFCSDPGGTYVLLTGDCDDDNIAVNPAATEICNGIDDDCDGLGDYDDGIIFLDYYADLDGDGYGSGAAFGFCSDPGGTYVLLTGDCDDDNTAVNPAATEICNGIDDDCDGLGDYDDGIIFLDYYADLDGDGYGSGAAFGFCSDPGGTYVLLTGDCDDDNIAVNPAATEICNGIDDDCDGLGDYDDGIIFLDYYADLDGDGYGSGAAFGFCSDPGGTYVLLTGDCDDDNTAVNPAATEICNGIDDDCDGLGDYDDGIIFLDYYADLDGDGYGTGAAFGFCSDPGGTYVLLTGDCNDGDNSIYPDATEVCNFIDDDCDGTADDGITYLIYYTDADLDAYGAGLGANYCSDPGAGFSLNNLDCEDGDASINPGEIDLCNGIDNDCDGLIDNDAIFTTYYYDGDGDSYGNSLDLGTTFCTTPGVEYVLNNTDCDDANSAINPGASEICNAIDDDCNGTPDDGLLFTTYYADIDSDSYGDAFNSTSTCDGAPSGYVTDNTDCDDVQSTVNPGATEICDGLDNDCDGDYDEGTVTATVSPSGTVQACKGEPEILTANAGIGYTYQWFKNGNLIIGATSMSYSVTKPANYQVQVNIPEGCFALSEATFVAVGAAPNATISAPNGTSLCALVKLKVNYNVANSYQWYKDDALIPGATNYLYVATTAGDYYCIVTNISNGCDRTSATLTVTACKEGEIVDEAKEEMDVYPNPAMSEFTVELTTNVLEDVATIQLYNIMGELIYNTNTPVNNGLISEHIALENTVPGGLYIVKVLVGNNEYTKQLVIQK